MLFVMKTKFLRFVILLLLSQKTLTSEDTTGDQQSVSESLTSIIKVLENSLKSTFGNLDESLKILREDISLLKEKTDKIDSEIILINERLVNIYEITDNTNEILRSFFIENNRSNAEINSGVNEINSVFNDVKNKCFSQKLSNTTFNSINSASVLKDLSKTYIIFIHMFISMFMIIAVSFKVVIIQLKNRNLCMRALQC